MTAADVDHWTERNGVAIRIHPRGIHDMGNLLAVARERGMAILGVKKVRVLPWVVVSPSGVLIVEVEPWGEMHNTPDAGESRQKK